MKEDGLDFFRNSIQEFEKKENVGKKSVTKIICVLFQELTATRSSIEKLWNFAWTVSSEYDYMSQPESMSTSDLFTFNIDDQLEKFYFMKFSLWWKRRELSHLMQNRWLVDKIYFCLSKILLSVHFSVSLWVRNDRSRCHLLFESLERCRRVGKRSVYPSWLCVISLMKK